ncbi:MAG: hypothetical protein A2Z73_04955 [Deltaproteobacteria bacterium RBG_13_60_28]|nr:MAG: hypothetical protein A2Z73_04955 [Deltaproteobacteria bacterium RBG_13_60_28]
MERAGIKGLAALMLAVVLVWPGALWGQGQPLTGGRFADSPRQVDKPSLPDQKKKKKQVREKLKKPRISGKESVSGKRPVTKTHSPTNPPKGAPIGPPGQ